MCFGVPSFQDLTLLASEKTDQPKLNSGRDNNWEAVSRSGRRTNWSIYFYFRTEIFLRCKRLFPPPPHPQKKIDSQLCDINLFLGV